MQFFDKTKIKIVSGNGGNGVIAWRREKFVDKGGPDGGDGGRGGDVYFVADSGLSTLMDFKFKSIFKATNEENGFKKNMHGSDGKDLYIKVPLGTIVKDCKTDKIIADMVNAGEKVLIAKGGKGGRGNSHFATPQRRAPQYCEPGEPGIERLLDLELKLIADVGLLGLPNAGKSTFISRISSAKPKIADYPFTTLVPNLGVVKKDSGDGYVVADIPGPIEGASEGVGLGYEFLRHVERCRFLVHIVDLTLENPLDNYNKINAELKKHSDRLANLYQIIALNKIDTIDDETCEKYLKEFKKLSTDVFPISAVTGENVETLKHFISQKVDEIPKPEFNVEVETDDGATNNDDNWFEVSKIDKNVFFVDGGKILRIAQVTDQRNVEQILHFQRVMTAMGIFEALKKKGIKDGDTIIAGKLELEYYDDEIYK